MTRFRLPLTRLRKRQNTLHKLVAFVEYNERIMKSVLIIISLFLIFLQKTPSVYAQETATSEARQTIEYALPYPGLLPDNPLYPVKMLRDRLISLLIADPVKKAAFNLLQSEKRFQAGMYLLNKDRNKSNLALATIAKGQDYFIQSLDNVALAQKQRLPAGDVTARMEASSQKQHEMLLQMRRAIPEIDTGYYTKIVETAEQITLRTEEQMKNR